MKGSYDDVEQDFSMQGRSCAIGSHLLMRITVSDCVNRPAIGHQRVS